MQRYITSVYAPCVFSANFTSPHNERLFETSFKCILCMRTKFLVEVGDSLYLLNCNFVMVTEVANLL